MKLSNALLWVYFIQSGDQLWSQHRIEYIQPLAGTAPSTTITAIKHSEAGNEKNANTIPSVTLPFAMTQWTPQTRLTEKKCIPPYFYKDSVLSGFRGSHWLSGSCTQDYGSFTIMPVVGKLKTIASEYSVPFSHKNEISGPSYYSLKTKYFHTEITSTLRCGMMRITALRDDNFYVLITPNSDEGKGFVKIDQANGIIYGYNPVHRIYQGWGEPAGFNGWFYIKVDKKFTSSGTFSEGEMFPTDSILDKKDIGAFAGLDLKKDDHLILRIGTSFSSLEGAKQNLEYEIGTKSFDEIRIRSTETWESALSQISIESKNEKDKRIFYTALYHAWQHPRLMSDADGIYPTFSGQYTLEKILTGNYYDDFSMWDIYRAQLPLLQLLKPDLINEFIRSMILKGNQGGWLPIFPCWNNYTAAMIGDHVTAFIASSYTKGIKDYDISAAYDLMRKNAFDTAITYQEYKNGLSRRALKSYLAYGYIPMEDSVQEAFHKKEQVSRTLEYAYDDYALSVVAKDLGKTRDFKNLYQRSLNYENVFDRKTGMVRGRHLDRAWATSFHADIRESYITEGTPRQYTFYVPHDIQGLADLMGGTQKLEQSLDSLFAKNEYWHGNEPGHQIPFMYNFTSSPWKTQREVYNILKEEYDDGPGGLSGNDDAGQMSAWFVFASMGLYPLDPVASEYMITTPLFDSVKIKTNQNSSFEIITNKKTAQSKYIKSIRLNGKKYSKNFIHHESILHGGKMEIELVDMPTSWGARKKNRSKEKL